MLNVNELLSLMQGGAMTPQDALGTYEAQAAERLERKRAERAAMQEAQASSLGSLAEMLQGSMAEPSSMEDVLTQWQGLQSVQGGDLQGGLSSLEGMIGGTQERPNPVLDPDDVHAIANDIRTWASAGTPPTEIRRKLHSTFANDPSLDYNASVAADLDFTIDRVLGG